MAAFTETLSTPLTERLSQTFPSKTKSVPAPEDLWERIEEWRASQRPVLSFAAAARALLEKGLAIAETEPANTGKKAG